MLTTDARCTTTHVRTLEHETRCRLDWCGGVVRDVGTTSTGPIHVCSDCCASGVGLPIMPALSSSPSSLDQAA